MNPPRQPVPTALAFCLFNWVVPGGGFYLAGDKKRALLLFALINGVFFSGLLYSGYLNVPVLKPGAVDFNIVAFLTFWIQVFHGGGALLLIGVERLLPGPLEFLVGDPGAAYSDLGTFHFVVAGGLNYFATVRLYDLLAGDPHDGEEKEKQKGDGEKADQEGDS